MKSFIDLLDEANAEIKTITVKELELIINQPGCYNNRCSI